jgi:hypothetical protein
MPSFDVDPEPQRREEHDGDQYCHRGCGRSSAAGSDSFTLPVNRPFRETNQCGPQYGRQEGPEHKRAAEPE